MKQLKALEEKMVSYRQLIGIACLGKKESLVALEPQSGALVSYYLTLKDMEAVTGKKILVRKTVAQKLALAAQEIARSSGGWKLLVTYGYRSPEIQTKYFLTELGKIVTKLTEVPSPTSLYEKVHRQIAVSSVAGHPTGGAVDVCLINRNDQVIDCGSTLYDLNDWKRYVFYPLKDASAKKARFILRKSMLSQGFAPFDGEWWHYSYGDKEWAAYYKKPAALYEQILL
jgi:D-alanyl-D-alanine dipeptidase